VDVQCCRFAGAWVDDASFTNVLPTHMESLRPIRKLTLTLMLLVATAVQRSSPRSSQVEDLK